MRIHRTKTGCLQLEQRGVSPGDTCKAHADISDLEENHSVGVVCAPGVSLSDVYGGGSDPAVGGSTPIAALGTRNSDTIWECVCGRRFKTRRGMRIHSTKKGCILPSPSESRESESQSSQESVLNGLGDGEGQICVHCFFVRDDGGCRCEQERGNVSDDVRTVEETLSPNITRELPDDVETKKRVKWPRMCDNKEWKALDDDISDSFTCVLKGSLEQKLACFSRVVYERGKEMFGVEETPSRTSQQPIRIPNRRQVEKGRLRREQRQLKQQLREASPARREGIEQLLNEVRKQILSLCRAERARKKRWGKRKERMAFLGNPYGFARKLFEEGKSGVLKVEREAVESHLKRTYSDPLREEPLPHMSGLKQPTSPGFPLEMGDIKWSEVDAVIRKARVRSAPGINGVSYKVLKKCPSAARTLWMLLREAWRKDVVPKEWCLANGIYIPKEEKSELLSQFRPISLLNVEGKIFFSVLSRRLSNFVLSNGYVDTSVQKAGIPGFPGCLEHASAIWSIIKRAKSEGKYLDVVWLDLANAYGSVPHQLIATSLEFFHVPQKVRSLLKTYYDSFVMRFSVSGYTTSWQPLEMGIPMGCSISPLLFVLAMEMVLRGAEDAGEGVALAPNQVIPPMRAYMDDVTILSEDEANTKAVLNRLQELIGWARMKFKAKKSRSLTLSGGKLRYITFVLDGEVIPTIRESPVKSLGRWYSSPITDQHRGVEIQRQVENGLEAIQRTSLAGKFKAWCLQYGLLPRVLWPLQMYDVAITRVERMQQKVSVYLRRWLGVPRFLSTNALYSNQSKLQLPFSSLVEEFKVVKARAYLMLRNSKDPVIGDLQPDVWTGSKWCVAEAVDNAEEQVKFAEVTGAVQKGRQGLGLASSRWWSKESDRGRRELVLSKIRDGEEELRKAQAVGQSQQGASTRWDDAVERRLSWSTLWQLEPFRLSFIIKAVYDVLPSGSNLVKWQVSDTNCCSLCGERETLEHVLSACRERLPMYTWRHNQVLRVVEEVLGAHCAEVNDSRETSRQWIGFVKAGEKSGPVSSRRTGLEPGCDWKLVVDLDRALRFPCHIVQTSLRPDVVLWSDAVKRVYIIELTVPWEDNMEWAFERKAARYAELKGQCEDKGWQCCVAPIEVGCRGFVSRSVLSLLKRLGLRSKATQQLVKSLQESAESSSSWIWLGRHTSSKTHTA